MRPFPALVQGVAHTEDDVEPAQHAQLARAVRLVLGWAAAPLEALAHAAARLLGLQLHGRAFVQAQMLLLTALLLATSWAAAIAHQLRSLGAGGTGATQASYLLRQAEAVGVQLAAWGEIAQPTALAGACLGTLQAAAFLACLALCLLAPALGHVLTEALAGLLQRRYAALLQQLPRTPAWAGKAVPRSAALYWRLPEGAPLGELLEAMQADAAYVAAVNAALAQPGGNPDLPSLLAPVAPPGGAEWHPPASAAATPPRGASLNPLFSPEDGLGQLGRGWRQQLTPAGAAAPLRELSVASGRSTPSRAVGFLFGTNRPGGWRSRGRHSPESATHDDDSVSVAGSSVSTRSHGELKPPAEILADIDKMWAAK